MISPDLQTSLNRAFIDARQRRFTTLSLEQLLLALLHNPQAAEVLRACSVDISELHGHLHALVLESATVAAGTTPVEPEVTQEFTRALQRAIMHVQSTRSRVATSTGVRRMAWRTAMRVLHAFKVFVGQGTVDGADLVVAILGEKESPAAQLLRSRGVTRLDATRYLAHGVRRSDPAPLASPQVGTTGEFDVVLVNDDYTPMDFVVTVLRDQFGLGLDAATRVMFGVHHEGRAVAGRFPADIAAEKVERVQAAARQEEHPLRCIAEPAVTAA
jgi:ATP-dependent Clp protease ATP-binding subunit ClpA